MRFSLNFIKEFVEINKTPYEIVELLTNIGMEVEYLKQVGNDWVFEIEVTPNRYDWLSVVGIARELACVCGKKLKLNIPEIVKDKPLRGRDIIIENKSDCSFYVARIIENIKVEESPAWLRERVENCGVNSINNVVDITNYCMLKWGHPLHAFDLDKIKGNIYVRRAKAGEVFLGLDGKERVLGEQNLVIADEEKIIALAGIIGAKNTEVTRETKRILLEAAIFSPLTIRISRRRAGVQTESSYRFERGVCVQFLEYASTEAQEFIISLTGGVSGGYKEVYKEVGKKASEKKRKVVVSLTRLNEYIGEQITYSKIKRILTNLEFEVEASSLQEIIVSPPTFRFDIEKDVDVIEEILRFYGYDRIKPAIPFVIPQQRKDDGYLFKRELRNFLVSLGLREIITYSFTNENILKQLGKENYIKVMNPLRKQESVLRPTLLSGSISVAGYNLNQAMRSLRFFEIAHTYQTIKVKELTDPVSVCFQERDTLAITVTDREDKVFYLKGLVEEIMRFLNIENYIFVECSYPCFSNALRIESNNQLIGFLGKLDNDQKEEFDLKEDLYFAELDIEVLRNLRREGIYRPFTRYPLVYRDISIALKKEIKFRDIEKIIKEKTGSLLAGYEIIDVYKGEKCPSGFTAFTLRLFYHSQERTLTSKEVDDVHNKLREVLVNIKGVILR